MRISDGPSKDSSLGKGLTVLGWVLDHGDARADDIAAGLGLPLSSTYRFLRALREHGFVTDTDGAFTVGHRLHSQLAGLPASRVANLAAPFLEQLAGVTGETAVLTVRHGFHGICVQQVESAHQIRLAFRIGQLLPLYAGAGQRVLLAFAPDHVVRNVLEAEMRAFTPNTPGRAEVVRELAKIRANRFALSRGELTPGAVALAVPVMRSSGAVCALCVAGPQNRCPGTWQTAARRELDKGARSLAEVLGPQP